MPPRQKPSHIVIGTQGPVRFVEFAVHARMHPVVMPISPDRQSHAPERRMHVANQPSQQTPTTKAAVFGPAKGLDKGHQRMKPVVPSTSVFKPTTRVIIMASNVITSCALFFAMTK